MNSDGAIRRVCELVRSRGYLDGWTPEQVAARNITKLGEEFGELAELFDLPDNARFAIDRAGMVSKQTFENRRLWSDINGPKKEVSIDKICSEIADVMVVVLVLSGAIREITGSEFDPVVAAVAKATNDIGRGIRYSE